jgi:hypothetical protein
MMQLLSFDRREIAPYRWGVAFLAAQVLGLFLGEHPDMSCDILTCT